MMTGVKWIQKQNRYSQMIMQKKAKRKKNKEDRKKTAKDFIPGCDRQIMMMRAM